MPDSLGSSCQDAGILNVGTVQEFPKEHSVGTSLLSATGPTGVWGADPARSGSKALLRARLRRSMAY